MIFMVLNLFIRQLFYKREPNIFYIFKQHHKVFAIFKAFFRPLLVFWVLGKYFIVHLNVYCFGKGFCYLMCNCWIKLFIKDVPCVPHVPTSTLNPSWIHPFSGINSFLIFITKPILRCTLEFWNIQIKCWFWVLGRIGLHIYPNA